MDMNNPRILYAAMWEHGRLPWKVISEWTGGGLYKSTDGGDTWEKMKDGLPEEMGKMSMAVSRSNPEKVYALIESDSDKEGSGLFASTNAGKKWSRITNDHRLVQRAGTTLSCSLIQKDENTVYIHERSCTALNGRQEDYRRPYQAHTEIFTICGSILTTQTTSSFQTMGVPRSVSMAAKVELASQHAHGAVYRINVDNQFPYHIYAGQQDNTSVSIARSRELNRRRDRQRWLELFGRWRAHSSPSIQMIEVRHGRQLPGND
jgi:hypothetical protein